MLCTCEEDSQLSSRTGPGHPPQQPSLGRSTHQAEEGGRVEGKGRGGHGEEHRRGTVEERRGERRWEGRKETREEEIRGLNSG